MLAQSWSAKAIMSMMSIFLAFGHAHGATPHNGLQPHHNIGSDRNDPQLFRHRFEHHDPVADRLVYYQYKARRLDHVMVLDDLNPHECQVTRTDEGNASFTISLTAAAANLKQLTAGPLLPCTRLNLCLGIGSAVNESHAHQ